MGGPAFSTTSNWRTIWKTFSITSTIFIKTVISPLTKKIVERQSFLTISLHKKWTFPLRISSVNANKFADLVTFTEEIVNGRLYFLCSALLMQNNEKTSGLVQLCILTNNCIATLIHKQVARKVLFLPCLIKRIPLLSIKMVYTRKTLA